jgi:hypothetical protein
MDTITTTTTTTATTVMSNDEMNGDAFVAEAEKKILIAEAQKKMMPGGVGNENNVVVEAAELYDKAAIQYKLDKNCTSFVQRKTRALLHVHPTPPGDSRSLPYIHHARRTQRLRPN